jgi:hypothetical protein
LHPDRQLSSYGLFSMDVLSARKVPGLDFSLIGTPRSVCVPLCTRTPPAACDSFILIFPRADFSFEDVTEQLLSWLVKLSVLPALPPPDPAGFILAMEQTDVSSQG